LGGGPGGKILGGGGGGGRLSKSSLIAVFSACSASGVFPVRPSELVSLNPLLDSVLGDVASLAEGLDFKGDLD